MGDVRDSAISSERVRAVLYDANRAMQNPIRWVACGASSGQENCSPVEFSVIVAVSEPRICGDVAEVLTSIRYTSKDELHRSAWQASVLRLRRVDGKWIPGEWDHQSTN